MAVFWRRLATAPACGSLDLDRTSSTLGAGTPVLLPLLLAAVAAAFSRLALPAWQMTAALPFELLKLEP